MSENRKHSNGMVVDALTAVMIATTFLMGLPPANAQTEPPHASRGAEAQAPGTATQEMKSMHSMDMKKSMESMTKEMASMSMTGDADRALAQEARKIASCGPQVT